MTELLGYASDYRPEAGEHVFTTSDSVRVTAIAHPTWERFRDTAVNLPPTEGYIISPELITSIYPLDQIRDYYAQIIERVETVTELSEQHPKALILLGTATVDEEGVMRNSLAAISQGRVEGYIDKRGILSFSEAEVFSTKRREQATLLSLGHSALVCSDIMSVGWRRGLVSSTTETLLISSCWAVPQFETPNAPTSHEERFKKPLETTVSGLFRALPRLREVIIVDRALITDETDVKVTQFTGHFSRVKD